MSFKFSTVYRIDELVALAQDGLPARVELPPQPLAKLPLVVDAARRPRLLRPRLESVAPGPFPRRSTARPAHVASVGQRGAETRRGGMPARSASC